MTADLLEHLVRAGHEVNVFAEFVSTPYTRNGVSIHPVEGLNRAVAGRHDVFVTHPEVRTGAWAYVQGVLPYIGIVHNLQENTLRSLERCHPHTVIASSQYAADSLAQPGAVVIHPPLTGPAPTPSHGDRFLVVNVNAAKGGQMLSLLASHHPDLRFQAVAGGYGDQILDQPHNVEVIPHGANMDDVYASSYALLLPSQSETYGKVVAEAMDRGLPVIASDLPGVREAGGTAAVYVDAQDTLAWCDQVGRLGHDRALWAEMGTASVLWAKQLRVRSTEHLARWQRIVENFERCECGQVGRDDECAYPCGAR